MKKILSSFFVFLLVSCSGDQTQVSVKRSAYNYPSIRVNRAPTGKSVETLFYWQGYIHATDGFQQMDMRRRTVEGKLSEIFGSVAEEKDRQTLALGLRRAAEKAAERTRIQYPYEYSLMEAYSRGVNQFINENINNHTTLVKSYQAIAFTQENPRQLFPDWTPTDCSAVADAVAFTLSSSLPHKMKMGILAKDLWQHRDKIDLNQLFDHRPVERVFTLDSTSQPQTQQRAMASTQMVPIGASLKGLGLLFPPTQERESFGSNVAVVGGNFTQGGETILFGDPHVYFTLPHTFIENALSIAPSAQKNEPLAAAYSEIVGMSFPGVPGVIMGNNGKIGFQSTNHAIDADDGYVEFENDEGTKVQFQGKWVDIERVIYDLKVRSADGTINVKPVVVRWVDHHGPIISDHFPEIGNALNEIGGQFPGKKSVSYKWVGHRGAAPKGLEGTTEVAAVLRMNRAKNFQEFSAALIGGFEVGCQNFMYADTDGNIGYLSPGKVPVRDYPRNGELPVLGTGEMEWKAGFRTEVPQAYNPASHRLVNSNNAPEQNRLGTQYDAGFRAQRGTTFLDSHKGRVTVDLVKQLQNDTLDVGAKGLIQTVLVPHLAKLRLSKEAAAFANQLISWDAVYKRDQIIPVRFEDWSENLSQEYFQQTLSKAGVTASNVVPFILKEEHALAFSTTYLRLSEMLKDATQQVAAFHLIEKSLESSVTQWAKNSSEVQSIRWGQKNVLRFINFLEGIVPPLGFAPMERDGSTRTYNVAGPLNGPNFRMIQIFEKGKPIRGYNVFNVGNYDMRNSTEWMRETSLWDRGEYRELTEIK